MEHRYLINTSRTFVAVHDQNLNHTYPEQSYVHSDRGRASQNGPSAFHTGNMSLNGENNSYNCDSALRCDEHSSSSLGVEQPYPLAPTSGPFYDPLRQTSAGRSFCPVTQNHTDSNYSRHHGNVVHGIEECLVDSTMVNARDPYTTKTVYEGGDTGNNTAGNLTDLSISSNLQQGMPSSASQHWPRDILRMTPNNDASTHSIAGEVFQRNVRSRSTLDMDVNPSRTNVSNNAFYPPTGRLAFHPGRVVGSRTTVQDRNRISVTSRATYPNRNIIPVTTVGHRRALVSDTNGYGRESLHHGVGSTSNAGPVVINGHQQNIIPRRNPGFTAQNHRAPTTQALSDGHNSYSRRAVPAYMPINSYQHPGPIAISPLNALQPVPGVRSFTNLRPFTMRGWPIDDRLIQYLQQDIPPFLAVDPSALYDSWNLFDQHDDMRLEIDDLSYEELLALEESIGNVKTGLSEDLMSKCLRETMHHSSYQTHEAGTCVICLEEYENQDIVAKLNCNHNYHTGCIKKWLSMKNVCPICKIPALPDSSRKNNSSR